MVLFICETKDSAQRAVFHEQNEAIPDKTRRYCPKRTNRWQNDKNMKNINSSRKNIRINGEPEDGYVLYWMQINRRLHYNFALEYAVAYANRIGRPLVILEGLACDYPWATARTSTFILEGMAEHARQLRDAQSVLYIPYPEQLSGSYGNLVRDLCSRAAILISDEYPVFIMRERNEKLTKELDIPFHTIDSNGIIPMALSEKAPYSAYVFRKMMQKMFRECWEHPPQEHPLKGLQNQGLPDLPKVVMDKRKTGLDHLGSSRKIEKFVNGLSGLDKNIDSIEIKGTRRAALERLDEFTGNDLIRYDDDRNDPDKERTSRLSPWLHFGKISAF